MTETDSIHIPSQREVVEKQLQKVTRARVVAARIGRCLLYGGLVGVGGTFLTSALEPAFPDWLRGNLIGCSVCAVFVGYQHLLHGADLRSHLVHYLALKLDLDSACQQMRDEFRSAQPAEQADLGTLAAQTQTLTAEVRRIRETLPAAFVAFYSQVHEGVSTRRQADARLRPAAPEQRRQNGGPFDAQLEAELRGFLARNLDEPPEDNR